MIRNRKVVLHYKKSESLESGIIIKNLMDSIEDARGFVLSAYKKGILFRKGKFYPYVLGFWDIEVGCVRLVENGEILSVNLCYKITKMKYLHYLVLVFLILVISIYKFHFFIIIYFGIFFLLFDAVYHGEIEKKMIKIASKAVGSSPKRISRFKLYYIKKCLARFGGNSK